MFVIIWLCLGHLSVTIMTLSCIAWPIQRWTPFTSNTFHVATTPCRLLVFVKNVITYSLDGATSAALWPGATGSQYSTRLCTIGHEVVFTVGDRVTDTTWLEHSIRFDKHRRQHGFLTADDRVSSVGEMWLRPFLCRRLARHPTRQDGASARRRPGPAGWCGGLRRYGLKSTCNYIV